MAAFTAADVEEFQTKLAPAGSLGPYPSTLSQPLAPANLRSQVHEASLSVATALIRDGQTSLSSLPRRSRRI